MFAEGDLGEKRAARGGRTGGKKRRQKKRRTKRRTSARGLAAGQWGRTGNLLHHRAQAEKAKRIGTKGVQRRMGGTVDGRWARWLATLA